MGHVTSLETRNKISKAIKGRKLSEEHKNKLRIVMKGKENAKGHSHPAWNKGYGDYQMGEKHWNWQGGKTSINSRLRSNHKYIAWRISVFERDNFTCQDCKERGGYLHPHHLISVKDCINTGRIDLIYEINNGVTVCIKCHHKRHNWSSKNA